MLSTLMHVLGIPATKVPMGPITLLSYILPALVCYFIFAILAITPKIRPVRVALWPFVASLALRAAVSVEMSISKPELRFLNIVLVLSMLFIVIRTLHWTLAKEPLVRHLLPGNESKSVFLVALDLASSLRGQGWNWSHGLYIPRETRPTNRNFFAFHVFSSAVIHALICSALHRAVLAFAPIGSGPTPTGSSIFDEALPFFVRYFRSSIITILAAFGMYANLQMGYDLNTLAAILFLGQDPSQWPPLFDAPWRSTSLSSFWSRGWHQCFRHTFLYMGGYPLSALLGRAGVVIGSFLSSAIFHHIAMVSLDGRTEMWRMLVGFGIMGPGILAERTYYQWTGKRVGGVAGWIWTMAWLTLWGNVIVEGFARPGMFSSAGFVDSALPVRMPVEHWVTAFDGWLHASDATSREP